MRRIILKIAIITVTTTAVIASRAIAQEAMKLPAANKIGGVSSAGFFSHDGVNDFSKDLNPTERQEFEYYLPEPKKLKLSDDEDDSESVAKTNADPKNQTPDNAQKDIVATYGDPNSDVPVKAIDSAPAPYKGLLASIEQGREDLALQYARQWVMYNKRLDKVTKLAVGMAGVVQEKEGMIPQGSFASTAKGSISPDAVKSYEEARADDTSSGVISLDEKAQQIINKVDREMSDDANPVVAPAGNQALSMESKRMRFASHLAETYLYVPEGKLDILVFLRPQDKVAQNLGPDLEKLFQESRQFPNLRFKAISPDAVSPGEMAVFAKASQTTFPLGQGEALSNELHIKTFPSIVLVARQSGEAYVEKDYLEYEFVQQMLRKFGVMQ